MSSFSNSNKQAVRTRMRTILEQFPHSGKSVPEFCEANDLSVAQYHYWRKKFGYCSRRRKNAIEGSTGFVKVDFKEKSYSASFGFNGLLHYELQLPGGRLLRIPFEFDSNSLRHLLNILST